MREETLMKGERKTTQETVVNYPPGQYVFNLSIGYSQAQQTETVTIPSYCGVSDEEWLRMRDEDRTQLMGLVWQDWANNYIDGGWVNADEAGA
jgi:hypothetical protein